MAVVSVREEFELRDMQEYLAPDGRGVRTYTRSYLVIVDSKTTRGTEILAHASIPALQAGHPDDPLFATVRRRHPQQHQGWRVWRVLIEYSTETPDPETSNEDNPLDEPVKRSMRTEEVGFVHTKDRNGTYILNTAGVPYLNGVEAPRSISVYVFEKNYAEFGQAEVDALINHVNSAAIGAREPGTVKCTSISMSDEFRNGVAYVPVVMEFKHDPLGWQPNVPEYGYMARKPSTNELVNITTPTGDEKGDPISEPWPLDANGRSLNTNAIPSNVTSTVWEVLEETDFNDLGFGFP